MSQVITFEDYTPTPRYDELPWTEARIEEGTTSTGPWTQIDVYTLDPVDTDPANPASRDFTTELASDTLGLWYRIIFADQSGDTLLPTEPVQNVTQPDQNYVSREELKRTLVLSGLSYADEDIDVSIAAASRAVDDYTGRRFYTVYTESVRFYTPRWSKVDIDDIITVTDVSVIDMSGAEVALTEGTDYSLYPPNADQVYKPYEAIWMLRTISYPAYVWDPVTPDQLRVTGIFGWPVVPAGVVAATTILATRILRRQREAPFGIVTVGIETGATAYIREHDPDVKNLLCDFLKPKVMIS